MATFRAASSNTGGTTVAKPTGVVSGDVQYAIISRDDDITTPSAPTGGATWVQISTTQSITNGDNQILAIFRQIAGGSEPSTYAAGVNGWGTICISAYSGVDNVTPEANISVNNPNQVTPPTSPVTITANSVTTTATNQTVLYLTGLDCDTPASSFTAPSSPSAWNVRATETPAGQYSNGQICDLVFAASGATGSITGTFTQSGMGGGCGNFVAWLVALNSSAVPPVITAQPTQQTVTAGSTATFSETDTGGTSWQWYESAPVATYPPPSPGLYTNVPASWGSIGGATSSSYTTPTLSSSNTGQWYYCAVTNAYGTTNTVPARVWVTGLGPDARGLQ